MIFVRKMIVYQKKNCLISTQNLEVAGAAVGVVAVVLEEKVTHD